MASAYKVIASTGEEWDELNENTAPAPRFLMMRGAKSSFNASGRGEQ